MIGLAVNSSGEILCSFSACAFDIYVVCFSPRDREIYLKSAEEMHLEEGISFK